MPTDRPTAESEVAEGSVRVLRAGAVATVEFSGVGVRNTWSPQVDGAYRAALAEVDRDPEVRVVVVRGAGEHFCAGRAVSGLRRPAGERGGPRLSEGIDLTRRLRKPVIAAIHGSCAGVGLTLALLCDVRFASTTSVFSTAFVRRGLVSGHATGWLLQRVVGSGHATELMLSGRKLHGLEAGRIGLVNAVLAPAELDAHVARYAEECAAECSPRSMRVIKEQLTADHGRSYEEALAEAARLTEQAFAAADFAEGTASYAEHRRPRFPGLPQSDETEHLHGRP